MQTKKYCCSDACTQTAYQPLSECTNWWDTSSKATNSTKPTLNKTKILTEWMQTSVKLKLNAGKAKKDIFQQIPQQKYPLETYNLLNHLYLKLSLHFISYSRFLTFPIFKLIENKTFKLKLINSHSINNDRRVLVKSPKTHVQTLCLTAIFSPPLKEKWHFPHCQNFHHRITLIPQRTA